MSFFFFNDTAPTAISPLSLPDALPIYPALALPVPMKSIRGGAFDTYFESQATCQFQSGENPLSRKHNIGFRLALGACDLAPQATALLLHGTAAPKELELAEEVRV